MLVRPYQACDDPYLTDIEIKSYSDPWTEFFKQGSYLSIAVADGRVAAYCAVRSGRILRFAVHPSWRRMRIGSELMNTLKDGRLTILIPESNYSAQKFLQAMDFRCVNTVPKAFTELGQKEDGLYFLWKP